MRSGRLDSTSYDGNNPGEVALHVWWHMGKKPSHGALLQAENSKLLAERSRGIVKYKKPDVHPHKTTYTQEIADQICDIVASGQTVTGACRLIGMSPLAAFRWAQTNREGFGDRLQAAREISVEHLFDEILEIADDSADDVKIDSKGREKINYELVNRSKLRIETRKWIAGIVNPGRYGDKLQIKQDTTLKTVSDEPQPELIELAKEEWTNSYARGKGGNQ